MLTLCLITLGDLAILMADTGTTSVTIPARRYGMGTVTRQGWRLNRSADMFVLLAGEQPIQRFLHPRGTAI